MTRLQDASDDALLHAIGLGNDVAFRILVERHVDKAYAVAIRILRNPTDAEDVVQDAFMQVWTRRGEWQPGKARFSTWLFRVVTNRCIDQLRRPRTETMEAAPEIADRAADQVQAMMQEEAAFLLSAAMGQLPDPQRIALVFSYHENLSNAEIAEIMETSVFAVESLLKRGRQKLRHLLRNRASEILASFTND
ncbi:RNA polymerase sigma factor [Pannonibacter indicus]|uniref:RNA polymerase sigma factor n=1 Tax=Pannonibacter indicus TaxID=466044 RepID=UPI001FCB3CD9|nr:RNA polymerase sigma factor [Pannonibacter indicus]